MKICRSCGESKHLEMFGSFTQRGKEFIRGVCNSCRSLKEKRRREVQGDEIREADRERYRLNKDKDPSGVSKQFREQYLKRKYGLSVLEVENMLFVQDSKCAICQENVDDVTLKRLNVDHCHKTGKVRELLCTHCNTGLGQFRDSPEILIEALAYLERHND